METIGIVLTFIIIAALTLWFIILGKGHWFIKAIVVAVALYCSFGIWHSLNNLSGWPSDEAMPSKFMLHWALIKEPSKIDINQKGNILLWASERLDEDNESKKKRNEPRVYKLPYTPEMHEKLSKAMKQMAQGKGVAGEKSQGQGETLKGDGHKGNSGKKGYGSLSNEQDFIFYDLPPPVMPSKD
jgi:hypothetical protein